MDSKQKIIYTKNCLKFLDYKCVTPNDKDFRIYEGKNSVIPSMVDANFNDGFLNNWNWIHEIIQKINNSPITVPMNGIDSIMPYIEARRPIIKGLINNNKETVVEAINQFLIWYNEQK